MLTAHALSVTLDSVERLSDITLTVRAGKVLALIGASGAGKTLLAHALLGILPRNATTQGTVTLPRGRQIGFLPQQISYLDPLASAGTQIRWAARRAGMPPKVTVRLAAVGLPPHVARHKPAQLSGGMARRVLLAMAEAGDPDLIIADEPTSGLDPANRDMVLARLRRRAQTGGAVLLITHDLAAALPYADQVAILHDGQLGTIDPAAAFTGDGTALSPIAQAMWRALPQNDFHA